MDWKSKRIRISLFVLLGGIYIAVVGAVGAYVHTTPWGNFSDSYGNDFQAYEALYYDENSSSRIYVKTADIHIYVTGSGDQLGCAYWQVVADGFLQSGQITGSPFPLYQGQYGIASKSWYRYFYKSANQHAEFVFGAARYSCGLGWPTQGWVIYNYTDTSFYDEPYY